MSDPNRLTAIAEGAIPWGIFVERERMEHINWYEPQGDISAAAALYDYGMQSAGKKSDPLEIIRLSHGEKRFIERFVLPNGIRYALIRDAHGNQILSAREYYGLIPNRDGEIKGYTIVEPEIIRGTDLGNGYELKMFITHKSEEIGLNGKDTCASYVKKERHQLLPEGNAHHEIDYDVDPIQETLRLGYEYHVGLRYTDITLRPHIEQNWGTGHEIVFGINTQKGGTDKFLRLDFDQEGKLYRLYGQGKHTIQSSGTLAPGVSYTFGGGQQSIDLNGKDLLNPEVHDRLQALFGISYRDPLTLNIGVSTNNMFSNIDAELPDDPKSQLVFKNSNPLINPSVELSSII